MLQRVVLKITATLSYLLGIKLQNTAKSKLKTNEFEQCKCLNHCSVYDIFVDILMIRSVRGVF